MFRNLHLKGGLNTPPSSSMDSTSTSTNKPWSTLHSNATQSTRNPYDPRYVLGHQSALLSEPNLIQDRLILCVGPRRLVVNPLFSQHLRGGTKSTNNAHKFERFLREGVTSVGTIYGPMTFGRLPITLLKEADDGRCEYISLSSLFRTCII